MGSYTPTQSTYTVGTQVTYSCNTGLVFAAGSITMITCTNNGWVNPAPTCQAANCPSPPAIPNGAFAPIQTSGIYSIGSVVSYVCMPTFLLIGSASSTCLPLGTWSGTRNCTATACGIPPGSGTPGLVVSPTKTSYVIGERVTFSCTGGNLLFGSSTNMCLMSGQWLINSPVPTCNLGCTAPPAVVGNLGTFTPMQTAYFNGARVTYSCNFGYKFAVGSNTDNLCDGGWVKSAPTCVPVTCGHPPRPTNGDFFNFVATGIYS
uniref:Sushi domain-containing protein n=1 Tax=Ciona savignyi TaxID=51511 RepID=H2ZLJ8_CIOSA